MKTDWKHLEKFRSTAGFAASSEGCTFGAFQIPAAGSKKVILNVIATDGHDGTVDTGWEHVSVHAFDTIFTKKRIPTWLEMCFIKELFWEPGECVVQYHVPQSDHINVNEHVLHLWRCKTETFPMPPKIFV